MKSIIVASALALGAFAVDSKYYISNYTAGSTTKLVAFPLETCVPNGALSFNYVVYHCADFDSKIYSQVFDMDDPYCESEYTETSHVDIAVTNLAGKGYADCAGSRNYFQLFQFLGSCDGWENGDNPVATTIVATDACTFQKIDTDTGYPIYARTVCSGDGLATYIYVGDYTCSMVSALAETRMADLSCGYSGTSSAYSALARCVVNDAVDRCDAPISGYTTDLQFYGLNEDTDFQSLFMRMFPYSNLAISNVMGDTPNVNLTLDLSFCTQWEDSKYGPIIQNLGQETINALNYDLTICFACTDSMCVNSTMCDESVCDMNYRCAPMMTTSMDMSTTSMDKSVGALQVSIVTFLMTLLVFFF
jgi:hypothetical protein